MAIEADEKSFEKEVLKSKGLTLVDFWAPWCGPCRAMSPTIEELSKSGKIKVVKVNVDNAPNVAAGFNISSIPTLVMFKNGKPIDSKVGMQSLVQFTTWIEAKSK